MLSNHWLVQLCVPGMVERRAGSIIVVSSVGGLRGSKAFNSQSQQGSVKMSQVVSFWRRGGWRLLGGLLLVAGLAACGAPPSAQVAESASAAPRTPRVESTLGTQWGEGRESVTRTVEAARLDPERPRTVAQLRYSDEASIRRALGRSIDQQLSVQLAKVSTLGERVEDTFLIQGPELQNNARQIQIETELLQELSS